MDPFQAIKKGKVNAFIYIVDHNPTYSASLKKSIDKPFKYSIQTFPSGEKTIAHLAALKIKKKDIHIVFLGYHFFDEREHNLMNGIEILEAIKVVSPEIVVIMLYGPDEESFGAYARKSGAYAFVPKTDTIFMRINNIIMRVISQKKLEYTQRAFLFSVKLLVVGIILSVLTIIYIEFLS